MYLKQTLSILIFVTTFCSCNKTQNEVISDHNLTLWYKQPAATWMQALPVGNGRLGAMVFGNPNHERIQLNEDSMWPGGPDWGDSKGNKKDLEELRRLLKKGDAHKVDELIVERFSYKSVLRSHQTMGDLFIDFLKDREVENYTRTLNLNNAVSTVSYTSRGNNYSQKVFASGADDVLIVELETDAKEGMNFSVSLSRPEDKGNKTVTISNPSNDEITMEGMVTQYGGKKMNEPFPIDYGVKFETRVKTKSSSGSIKADQGKLVLTGAKKVTIILSCKTSFYHEDYKASNNDILSKVSNKSFNELLKNHIKDYQKYFDRVELSLGGKELDTIPTDKRLQRIKDGEDDPDLAAKLFQFGRYLLISSSRPGTNPANLQGIWNEHIEAPWNADYHLNINLQMNYWPAEVTNLSEMHLPLFDFSNRLLERGKITAKEQYGIGKGAVMHHATDLWAPAWMRAARPYWGSWIHGGGWLGQHYWEHYNYTKDDEFLKKQVYPYLKSIAEFYTEWLVWDENTQKWVSTPETSPENSYFAKDGKPAAISYGAAMGHQIIAEVFDNVLKTAKILNIEDDFTKDVRSKREKLFPGVVVSNEGRILEWNEAYGEPEKGHRHMSHLYALHPSNQITVADTVAFKAAQKTIDYRLEHGGAGTGWSRAWMINVNARLLNTDSAEENIRKFFQISIADNLFDEHPPFQIDGNFGYTAGVAELLMQSHEPFIRILPALPKNWQTGNVKGLKARGNVEVDLEWKEGKLVKVGVLAKNEGIYKIQYGSLMSEVKLPKNEKIWLNNSLSIVK
ncbi:glycoside hydrolase family 95 protein [Wocania ichthyoenteri]|uniref:glycoside hydrolase family 95 protein n=1 Tax=Wocania ichthyoenteri TaxID=1230531 RepID=UPI00053E140F|nr:glycoside hydrolase N-terminal domain-containing protein [Wocania ichthyoenteri]